MAGLATSLGAGAASNSSNQISGADMLFIFFGSNTTEGHPIVSLHVNKAIRNGANSRLAARHVLLPLSIKGRVQSFPLCSGKFDAFLSLKFLTINIHLIY